LLTSPEYNKLQCSQRVHTSRSIKRFPLLSVIIYLVYFSADIPGQRSVMNHSY